ncbi:Disease resistance protein RPS5 [Apostasia shenzhenica]|uniref:Disease resistance protein RPS5 n=1 Tax=Apostasia shenzhenica TaxID=1088818 RepID=A0A2I0B9Q2_9ASPA|nr:Disease resistance protein RPS5 [Apostasia shenzhenica]
MCVSFSIDPVKILSEAWGALSKPISYLRDPEPRVASLIDAMDDLRAKKEDLNNRVRSAALAGQTPTAQVRGWFAKVDAEEARVSEIQSDHDQKRSCRWCINRHTAKCLADVRELAGFGEFEAVARGLPPSAVQELPGHGATLGMGDYLSQLKLCLQDEGSRIIAIWGMGGVGKTTLLQSLNNDLLSSTDGGDGGGGGQRPLLFDHVIWAVATKDYKLHKLQRDIARRLGLPLKKDKVWQAKEIFEFLKNKSFLLLLDDLWHRVDLNELGIPHPSRAGGTGAAAATAGRQKVVFTTRLEGVCGQMDSRRKIKMECLKEDEAWALFQEKVGEETLRSHARIPQLARRVAKECDGLPLALVVIGTAMSTKKTPREWQNAITLLQKSQPYQIHGIVDNILPKLKFSYDNLPDEIIRKCFLFCSLWPEDFSISKTDLIECWMGHGLVDEAAFRDINEAYDSGHALIGSLKAACLLEPGDDGDREVKMHDVVRDLALWITSDCGERAQRHVVQSSEVGSEASQSEVEKISLVRSDITDTACLPANCAKLETLMLQGSISFKSLVTGFFDGCRGLTYLDLSYTAIYDLPSEIGQLGNLRYLNLSHTNVPALPREVGFLRELRFLLLRELDCITIPGGVIQKLGMLCVIDMTHTWCENWMELAKLWGQLKGVGIVLETIQALQQLAQLPNVPVWRLDLRKLVGFTDPLQLLSPSMLGARNIRSSMQSIKIEFCESLEVVSMDSGGGLIWNLPRLEEVELRTLPELKEIVWRGVVPGDLLPSLTVVKIYGCGKLSNISWVLRLPSLEELTVHRCGEMEHVIDEEHGGGSSSDAGEAFPSLRRLCLSELPNLKMFATAAAGGGALGFPSLEVVQVIRCPTMHRLPFGAELAGKKLKEIWGEKFWWDKLEMEEDARAALLPRFKKKEPR